LGLASFYVEAHSVFHALLSFYCEVEGGIGLSCIYISFWLANDAHIVHYINKLALCCIILMWWSLVW